MVIAWVFVILGFSYDPTTGTWNSVSSIITSTQEFWYCLGITIL